MTTVKPKIHPFKFAAASLDPHAIKVVQRLTSHGHLAYLVGGCVRDLLLNCTPKDFDVATDASPEQIRKIFRNSRLIGRRFRLAHVVFGPEKVIEVATFRRQADVEVRDGQDEDEVEDLLIRHDNVYGEPHEDAKRRDFTINGLFYDLRRQEVIDYVDGFKDIEERAIRTIGAPDVRFREDPVRMLRAIKFSSRLDVGIAPDVYDAIVGVRQELTRAAKPRVLEEVLRLLRGGAAQRAVYLLWDTGVLSVVLPELMPYIEDVKGFEHQFWRRLQTMDAHIRQHGPVDDAVLLALLLYDAIVEALHSSTDKVAAFEDFLAPLGRRFTLSRRLKERMLAILIAQRRLERGRAKSIEHRSYYRAAVDFYEIQQRLYAGGKGELNA